MDETHQAAPEAAATTHALPAELVHAASARLGYDLSTVRVVEGEHVAAAGALAWARGNELHFAPGAYDPSSVPGRALIGHELVHLVQQAEGRVGAGTERESRAAGLGEGGPGASLEAEADHRGATVFEAPAARPSKLAPLPGTTGSAPRQFKMTTMGQIGTKGNGYDWMPHKTQTQTVNTATTSGARAFGTGAHVEGTHDAIVPVHVVTPKPVDAMNGEATGLVATVGPTSPRYAPVTAWPRTGALDAAAQKHGTGFSPYVPMPLLPAVVGAPGRPDHYVAMPQLVASYLETRVMSKIVQLVRDAGAWVAVQADVTHADDAPTGARYAQSVKLQWWELDPIGNEVAGTRGLVEVQIAAPSVHGAGGNSTASVPDKVGTADNPAKLATAAHHRAPGTAVTWRTEIVWGPTTADGDGTFVEARKLGPDHRLGEEPYSDPTNGTHVWNARTRALSALTTSGTTKHAYVSGHLLNHHVGGPGNDARNLAPIPGDANSKEQTEVEAHVKKLVNEQKAWVYYKVSVTHSADPSLGVQYPSAFDCQWHQLDTEGREAANTRGHKQITFDAPSVVQTKVTAAPKPKDRADTYVVNTLVDPTHKNAQPGTATTKLAFNEVVLGPGLGPVLNYQSALVSALEQLELHGYFQDDLAQSRRSVEDLLAKHAPGAAEQQAFDDLEKLGGELETAAGQVTNESYATVLAKCRAAIDALAAIHLERKSRCSALRAEANVHLHIKFEKSRADALYGALDGAIKVHESAYDAFEKYIKRVTKVAMDMVDRLMKRLRAELETFNVLLRWNDDPRLTSTDDVPDDLAGETTRQVTKIASNVQGFYDRGAPGSPMQHVNSAYAFDSGPFDSAYQARDSIAKHGIEHQHPPFDFSGMARMEYDRHLLESLDAAFQKDHLQTWPAYDRNDGNLVAASMQFLVGGLRAMGWNAQFVQDSIKFQYWNNTAAFESYWLWLKDKLGQ